MNYTLAYDTVSPILFASLGLFIIFAVCVGNYCVLLAVWRESNLRGHVQNFLIVSLAIADLLVGLLVMPLTLTYELLGQWIMGSILCELWLALDVLFVTASILHLCAISLDRYWSVVYPLSYSSQRSTSRIGLMIALAWLISLLICLPPLVGWRPDRQDTGQCALSTDVNYVLYSSIGSFYLPVTLLVLVYVRMYLIGRKQLARRKTDTQRTVQALIMSTAPVGARTQHSQSMTSCKVITNHQAIITSPALSPVSFEDDPRSTAISTTTSHAKSPLLTVPQDCPTAQYRSSSVPNQSDKNLNQVLLRSNTMVRQQSSVLTARLNRLKRRERQATIMVTVVLAAFIVCWMPFFVIYVLQVFGVEINKYVFLGVFWLGYCNSAVNPVIYAALNRDFRKAFAKLCGMGHRVRSVRH